MVKYAVILVVESAETEYRNDFVIGGDASPFSPSNRFSSIKMNLYLQKSAKERTPVMFYYIISFKYKLLGFYSSALSDIDISSTSWPPKPHFCSPVYYAACMHFSTFN